MPGLAQEAKNFLFHLSAAPRKKLGQNFMVREQELAFIADTLAPKKGDKVLEIGPGLGFLTRFLLKKEVSVIAVEKDPLYAKFLRGYFKGAEFTLAERDVLETDLEKDFNLSVPIKVVGNIPYNITSPLLQWLVAQRLRIAEAVLTVQREVAERLEARPGGKTWGSLSVFLQYHADVSLVGKIGRESFYPSPKIDSAVVRLVFLKKPRIAVADEEAFFTLVRRAFQKRRKMLVNSLVDDASPSLSKPAVEAALKRSGIAPARRPETLSLPEWGKLFSELNLG